jgi:hypothetical protein
VRDADTLRQIFWVADALLARRTLSGDEVKQVMADALGGNATVASSQAALAVAIEKLAQRPVVVKVPKGAITVQVSAPRRRTRIVRDPLDNITGTVSEPER